MLKEGKGETAGVAAETQRLVKVLTHHPDTRAFCLTDGQTDKRTDGCMDIRIDRDSKVGDEGHKDRQTAR